MSDLRYEATPLIQMEGISRTYEAGVAVDALRDVDLSIETGGYVAISGPSGSGKSTLLHILGCIDRPTAGRYCLAGIEATALSDRDRAALRSTQIGFVFQAFHLLRHLTVVENVLLGTVYRRLRRRTRIENTIAALNQVDMAYRADFLVRDLSGGEKQRVAIARAIAQQPKVLLADEPTGNLDSGNTEALLDVFDRLVDEGLTVVVVTHDPVVSQRASTRMVIADGSLSPAETRHT